MAIDRAGALVATAPPGGGGGRPLQVPQGQHAGVVFELLDGPGGPPDGGPLVGGQILSLGPACEVGLAREGGARRPVTSNGALG